jgi:hypothetical protein
MSPGSAGLTYRLLDFRDSRSGLLNRLNSDGFDGAADAL